MKNTEKKKYYKCLLVHNQTNMEKTKTREIIDMVQLERELMTNDYDQREIDEILARAREINADDSHAAQKLNELIYQEKGDLD